MKIHIKYLFIISYFLVKDPYGRPLRRKCVKLGCEKRKKWYICDGKCVKHKKSCNGKCFGSWCMQAGKCTNMMKTGNESPFLKNCDGKCRKVKMKCNGM